MVLDLDEKGNEKFRSIALRSREVVLEKNHSTFYVLTSLQKASVTMKCYIMEEPVISIQRHTVNDAGQKFPQRFEVMELPSDLTSKDFDELKKIYFDVQANLKEDFKKRSAGLYFTPYISARERKQKLEDLKAREHRASSM